VRTAALGTARASSSDLNLPRVAWRGAWRRVACCGGVSGWEETFNGSDAASNGWGKGNNGSVA